MVMEFKPRDPVKDNPEAKIEEALPLEEEIDLEDYYGDPDGDDNVIDHGTPRKPEAGSEEEKTAEAAAKAKAEAEAATAEAGTLTAEEQATAEKKKSEETQEETSATGAKHRIKVQGEELEVTTEELVTLAQKGEDYTRKTQALSEREKRVTGHEGLIHLIDTDPNFRHHVKGYDPLTVTDGGEKTVKEEVKPIPSLEVDDKPPEDPVERVKWETRKEVLEQVAPVIKALEDKLTTVEQGITQVGPQVKREVDPYGEATQKALHAYLKTLPDTTARTLFNSWNSDAKAYQDAYTWMRPMVIQKHQELTAAKEADDAGSEKTVEEKAAEAKKAAEATTSDTLVRKETEKAPLLETSGAADVDTSASDKAKQAKTLHTRIKNQEASPHDVGKLFDLLDPLD